MRHIIGIGGGFAGLWSAVSAVRRLEELGQSARVTLINLTPHHSIRVRNYEEDLTDTLVDLASVLDPIGVNLVVGRVTEIDVAAHELVVIDESGGRETLGYDKLVLASGSQLVRPTVPGEEHIFDIDTHTAACRLQAHLDDLVQAAPSPGRFTALVVGSGATGVEIATELPKRLKALAAQAGHDPAAVRIILADRQARIASGLGGGQPVIERACRDLGVELLPNCAIVSADAQGVTLADGGRIEASTIIWCGGMRADILTHTIPVPRDRVGRLFVDTYMRVQGAKDVYAAGDTAHALIDGERPSVMSCQHARPMGRYAGTNAVNALFGQALLPLTIDWYTNIIDLGDWGAVYTQGWDRVVVAEGHEAKRTKMSINRERIYPPTDGDREKIIEAGATTLQAPPSLQPLSTLENL
jgi:NADH:ubiquinone reductase (H+-translocating)